MLKLLVLLLSCLRSAGLGLTRHGTSTGRRTHSRTCRELLLLRGTSITLLHLLFRLITSGGGGSGGDDDGDQLETACR